jgi:hypothetical protein
VTVFLARLATVAAWIGVFAGVGSAHATAQSNPPRPRAKLMAIAHEKCVVTYDSSPCRSASDLVAEVSGSRGLAVWSNAHRLRGALLDLSGSKMDVEVRDLGPPASEANVGVSVARTAAGNFVVAWGTGFGVRRAVRFARLDANGRVLSRGTLRRRYVTPTTRHIALAPVASGYLLFAIDTPRAWQEGPTRVRVLHLGRRFQPIGPWRLVVGDVDDPGVTATALDDHEVAVTISPAGGTPPYAHTYIVDGAGRLLRDSSFVVAVRSGDRGRLLPWPTAPPTLLNATSSDVLPQTMIDAVFVGDQPRFLWWAYGKSHPNGEPGAEEQWVTGLQVPADAWLAAIDLRSAQLIATERHAYLLGLRPRARGYGGGNANDIVIARTL